MIEREGVNVNENNETKRVYILYILKKSLCVDTDIRHSRIIIRVRIYIFKM